MLEVVFPLLLETARATVSREETSPYSLPPVFRSLAQVSVSVHHSKMEITRSPLNVRVRYETLGMEPESGNIFGAREGFGLLFYMRSLSP